MRLPAGLLRSSRCAQAPKWVATRTFRSESRSSKKEARCESTGPLCLEGRCTRLRCSHAPEPGSRLISVRPAELVLQDLSPELAPQGLLLTCFSVAPAPPRARGFAPSPRFARCAVRMFGALKLWTTAQVAEEIGFSEDWVRDHAAELGGIRMGHPTRGQLRFEPPSIEAYKQRRQLAQASPHHPLTLWAQTRAADFSSC